MEVKTLQVLHIQMQALTRGAEEYARLLSSVTKTVGQMVEAAKKAAKGKKEWYIPENDYGTLVRLLTTDPWLMVNYHKYSSVSWRKYANRVSKLVRWNVDKDVLKYNFDRLK
jgi:hypothetical protein